MKTEADRLAVAMRFVDWFTSRGENYEHNMKIIDKHLKGLAVGPGAPCALGAAGASLGAGAGAGAGGGPLGSIGAVATSGSSSSVHSYYTPGNRVAFHPNPDHAR